MVGIDGPNHRTSNDDIGNKWIGRRMMNFGYSGLAGLLVLAGDIWAILNISQSAASNGKKLIWILAVLLLPLFGLILWYFIGPRGKA